MKPRADLRVVPETSRYFAVDLGPDLGLYHFRFPSYGKAARMLGLLQGFEKGDGLDKLVELLDVAGYAIGTCWNHRAYDLSAGTPPGVEGDGWRTYGDTVVDELQEHGLALPDLMKLVNGIIGEMGAKMAEVAEAEVEAPNS